MYVLRLPRIVLTLMRFWRRMRVRLCSFTQSRRFSFSCYLYVLRCVMCVYQRYWYEQSRLRLYLFGKCRCESSFTVACKSLRESVLDRILIGYMYRCMIVVNMYKVCVLLHPPRQKRAEREVLDTYVCASICVYMNLKRRLASGGSV